MCQRPSFSFCTERKGLYRHQETTIGPPISVALYFCSGTWTPNKCTSNRQQMCPNATTISGPAVCAGGLRPVAVLQAPHQRAVARGMPTEQLPSDHISLVADLSLIHI